MILHQKSLDYKKQCSIPFGSYLQAHTVPEPRNTRLPRTLDCVYLRYTDNEQGGHSLLDLNTGRLITRHNVTVIPITSNIIDIVHQMAQKDGMKTGCKIENRTGVTLNNSSWIAGVDTQYSESTYETNDDISIADMNEKNPNITAGILHEKQQDSNPTGVNNDEVDDDDNSADESNSITGSHTDDNDTENEEINKYEATNIDDGQDKTKI
jgi:hypothetical protein